MFNIRQIYLDHVGFKGAWFQDVHIPLFDSEKQSEKGTEDSILSLTNGGGKTTLLSLVFCCFIPDKRYFVQHLQKAHHHFRDYFTSDPGLILIELERSTDQMEFPTDDSGEVTYQAQKLVVGQYVTIDPATGEDHRQFFGFEPTGTIRFEDVPSMGKGSVKNLEEVKRWLQKTNEQESGFFRPNNNNQAEWMKWLDNEGVDTWIIRKQVEFCRAEGGIDSYMNFQSEEDFLKEFFHMVMPPGSSEENRELLQDALKKLRKRPEYERKRKMLQELRSKMEPFSMDAGLMVVTKRELQENKTTAGRYHAALSKHINYQETILETNENLKQDGEAAKSRLLEQKRERSGELEGVQSLMFQKKIENLKQAQSEQNQLKKQSNIREKEAKAALILNEKNTAESAVASYEDIIRNANSDLRPIEEARDLAAFTLKAKLQAVWQQKNEERIRQTNEQQAISEQKTAIDQKINDNNAKRSNLAGELGRINTMIQQRNTAYERLLDERLLEEGVSALEAMQSLQTSMEQQTAEIEQKNAQRQTLLDTGNEIEEQIRQSVSRKSQLESQWQRVQTDLEKGLEKQRELQQVPLLFQMMGDEEFNPDSQELTTKLKRFQIRKDTESDELRIELINIKQQIEFIEKSGSLLLDENTRKAINFLEENGVDRADFYPEYLSKIHNSVETIAALIESDPGRYLGVVVHDKEELKKAEKLIEKSTQLIRPVMISLPCDQPAKEPDYPSVILPPEDRSFYSEKAVRQRLEQLKQELPKKEKRLEEINQLRQEITELQRKQQSFIEEFGHGKLDRLTELNKTLGNDLKKEEEKQIELEERKQSNTETIRSTEQQINELQEGLNRLRNHHREIEVFHRDYDRDYKANLVNLEALNEQSERIEEETRLLRRELVDLDEKIQSVMNKIAAMRADLDQYRDRIAKVETPDTQPENFQPDLSATEESLEQDYRIKREQYNSALAESGLDSMRASLEAEKINLTKLNVEFERAAEGLDRGTLAELSRQEKFQLEELEQSSRTAAENAMERVGEIKSSIKQLQNENQEFEKSRKYRTATIPEELENFSVDQLQAQKENIRVKLTAIAEDLETAELKIAELNTKIEQLKSSTKMSELLQKQLSAYASDFTFSESDLPILPQAQAELEALITGCNNEINTGQKQYDNAKFKAERSYQDVLKIVRTEEFREAENRIAVEIENNPFEDVCEHVQNHREQIDQRIDVLNHEIEATQEDLELCVNHLMNHAAIALGKLRFVTRASKIPASVPNLGGKQILKMNANFASITKEQQKVQLEAFVQSLAESQIVPGVGNETGDELTAAIIKEISKAKNRKGSLGIEIIKLSKLISWTPVDQIKGSGGESMTSALLLYLVIAQLRAETRANNKKAVGGFLLMDNPFSRATTPQLVKPQVELARELGFQLIYATAIKDFNAQSLFSHFVQLRQSTFDRLNERIHIKPVEEKAVIEAAEFTTLNR